MPEQIAAALIAATMVALVLAVQTRLAWLAYTQKAENDHRDQQWKRIQWAVDLSLAEGERELEISGAVLEHLAAETHVEPADYLVIRTALQSQRAAILAELDELRAHLARPRQEAGAPGSSAAVARERRARVLDDQRMDRDSARGAQQRLAALERALEHNTRALETVARQIAVRRADKEPVERRS